MKNIFKYLSIVSLLSIFAFNVYPNNGTLCPYKQAEELRQLFGDVSFDQQLQHIKDLILLRKKENDPKILKKLELLLCSTGLLERLPHCFQEYSSNGVRMQVATGDSRYELLQLAIMYDFKELIELIYKHVSPAVIADFSDKSSCSSEAQLVYDMEIVLNNVNTLNVTEMIEFLMRFKDLKQLYEQYPLPCKERMFSHPQVGIACLMIDKEIERREQEAHKNFLTILDELADRATGTRAV